MEIVAAGVSGFIGAALLSHAQAQGWKIRQLVRRNPQRSGSAFITEYQWDPDSYSLDPEILAGVDAIICMSGAGIADWLWTKKYRRLLWDSRRRPLITLRKSLLHIPAAHRPQHLLAASAVGYYGSQNSSLLVESRPAGKEFLARLCGEWERVAATLPVSQITHLRTGLVLGPDGGILKTIMPLYQHYLGGRLGGGQQYMPTISLQDYIRALDFILQKKIAGAVNLVGPNPVSNQEFNSQLANLLGVKAFLPVPEWVLKSLLGEMSFLALQSARTIPDKLLQAGFNFAHPTLSQQLKYATRV